MEDGAMDSESPVAQPTSPQPPEPVAGRPKTVPGHALADIMYRLTVDMQVRLSSEGRGAVARRFDNGLGPYLGRLGKNHPKRDLWNEQKLAFLPAFVIKVVDGVGGHMRKESQTPAGEPTPPLGREAVNTACVAILCDQAVRDECWIVVKKVKKELGVGKSFVTEICPEFSEAG
jgi:hypothetical protein